MATTPTSTDLISRIPGVRTERCQSCAKKNGFKYNGHPKNAPCRSRKDDMHATLKPSGYATQGLFNHDWIKGERLCCQETS